jgi:hypothetical protein
LSVTNDGEPIISGDVELAPQIFFQITEFVMYLLVIRLIYSNNCIFLLYHIRAGGFISQFYIKRNTDMTEQNETSIFRRIFIYFQAKKFWPYLLLLIMVLLGGAYLLFQVILDPSGLSGLIALNQQTATLSEDGELAGEGEELQTETNLDGTPAIEGTPTKTRRPTSTDEYKSRFRTFTPTSEEPSTPTPFGWTASPTSTVTNTATNTPVGWTASPTSTATKTPIGWTASPTKTATETPVPSVLTVQLNLTANQTSLEEPGGWIPYQIEVENTFTGSIEVISLTDSVIADLSGEGTCDQSSNPYPLALAAGDSYTCSFYVNFQGEPDDVYQNTVTLQIEDTYGRTLTVSDDQQVTIVDVLPAITVSKIADSASVIEPGEYVTFTVEVTNDSVEPVHLIQLLDDQVGNLNNVGTCDSDLWIAVGNTYSCEYDANVTGTGGDTYTNIVSIRVTDDDWNSLTETATASVEILNSVTSTISGQVRFDADGDGNMSNPDPGLEGVEIELEDAYCTPRLNCRVEFTDADGRYSFDNVAGGSYFIVATDLPDYFSTNDSAPPNDNQIPLTVVAGVDYPNNDFIDSTCPGPTDLVNGYVSSTTPADNTTVSLTTSTIQIEFDQPMNQTGGGSVLLVDNYNFGLYNLTGGGTVPFNSITYNGLTDTATLEIDIDDPDWQPGAEYEIVIQAEIENSCGKPQGFNVSRSFFTMSAIRGQVRVDSDGDGDLSDADPILPGVTIELQDSICLLTINCRTTVTDSNGEYEFTDLAAGDYQIHETDLVGYTSINDADGGDFNLIEVNGLASSELLGEMDFLDEEICPSPHPVTGFVSSTDPFDGQTGVPLTTSRIKVVFTQDMVSNGTSSPSNVNNYSLRNLDLGRDLRITSALYDPNLRTVYVYFRTSPGIWRADDLYMFTIDSGLQNSCFVRQGVEVEINFRTVP